MRGSQLFVHLDEFLPERWTDRPELIIDRGAFHPFMIGPYNCVDK
jgi:hypothetical protein